MKKLTGLVAAVLLGIAVTAAEKNKDATTSYEIDHSISKVHWTGKKVSGEHTGYLLLKAGNVILAGSELTGGAFEIDLNSIVCTDITNEQWNQKLVGHLKSDDFFSVEDYPTANFRIKSLDSDSDGKYKVTGALSMKGITHEISFPAKVNVNDETLTATGTASIDRTKWEIKYGSGKFFQGLGDKMIKDEFEISFEIVAKAVNEIAAR